MKRYVAARYCVQDVGDGDLAHFNAGSLEINFISSEHHAVLDVCVEPRTREGIEQACSDIPGVAELIDELVEFDMLCEVTDEGAANENVRFNVHPRVVAFRIALTETCNLACRECFVVKNRDRLRTMSSDTMDKVVAETVRYGSDRPIRYHFFGGEPSIKFDLIKRAVAKAEAAVAEGCMMQPTYGITTNLTLLTDEMLAFFKRYRFTVGVSVDGTKEVHDAIRIYRNGRGTFEDVHRNYHRLIDAGIDAYVLITPHPDHLGELSQLFESVLDAFPMKRIMVNTPFEFNTLKWSVPGKTFARALIDLTRIARDRGVEVDSAITPIISALGNGIKRAWPCSLVDTDIMVSVDPLGNVSFCPQRWHHDLTVPLEFAREVLRVPVHHAEQCADCVARYLCGGPCPAFQRISGERIDSNKCAFMRAIVREILSNVDLFME